MYFIRVLYGHNGLLMFGGGRDGLSLGKRDQLMGLFVSVRQVECWGYVWFECLGKGWPFVRLSQANGFVCVNRSGFFIFFLCVH